jgi:hypothetical protein
MQSAKRQSIVIGIVVVSAIILEGCSSSGSVATHGSVGYSYGYYDPWYRHDVIVLPPARPPERPRPEHPIHRPPRPTPLPARPLPRPAPAARIR